jgi:hypothetical protein
MLMPSSSKEGEKGDRERERKINEYRTFSSNYIMAVFDRLLAPALRLTVSPLSPLAYMWKTRLA